MFSLFAQSDIRSETGLSLMPVELVAKCVLGRVIDCSFDMLYLL